MLHLRDMYQAFDEAKGIVSKDRTHIPRPAHLSTDLSGRDRLLDQLARNALVVSHLQFDDCAATKNLSRTKPVT